MKYLCEFKSKYGSKERKAVTPRELSSIERKRKNVHVFGEICESRFYGDMCAWCYLYRKGLCRASTIKDSEGRKWHVWSNK